MKIGVLGGTFDPVHRGHIAMAQEARNALGLTEVLLVPAGRPVFKTRRVLTPAEHRVAMLRLAVAGVRGMKVSTIEIERPGLTFTVDTIAALKQQYSDATEIYFILGQDNLESLAWWRDPVRLMTLCRLVTVPRPGCPPPDLEALERDVPGIVANVINLEKPFTDISASLIREMAGRGEPIDHLVPRQVAGYIVWHKLYVKTGEEK